MELRGPPPLGTCALEKSGLKPFFEICRYLPTPLSNETHFLMGIYVHFEPSGERKHPHILQIELRVV